MTDPIKPAEPIKKSAEDQKIREKMDRREREMAAVQKQVEDAAAAHLALVNKYTMEDKKDAEEAEKKK